MFTGLRRCRAKHTVLRSSSVVLTNTVSFPRNAVTLRRGLTEFRRCTTYNFARVSCILGRESVRGHSFSTVRHRVAAVTSFYHTRNVASGMVIRVYGLSNSSTTGHHMYRVTLRTGPKFLGASANEDFNNTGLRSIQLVRRILNSTITVGTTNNVRGCRRTYTFVRTNTDTLNTSTNVTVIRNTPASRHH